MDTLFKQYKKYLSLRHYITILRRQPEHIRHMYAVFFAGIITCFLGASILYFDYGFWHETYSRGEVIESEVIENREPLTTSSDIESPKEMLGNFFKEAKGKLDSISIQGARLPTGKDTYKRE